MLLHESIDKSGTSSTDLPFEEDVDEEEDEETIPGDGRGTRIEEDRLMTVVVVAEVGVGEDEDDERGGMLMEVDGAVLGDDEAAEEDEVDLLALEAGPWYGITISADSSSLHR
jgi:hypothetical protein